MLSLAWRVNWAIWDAVTNMFKGWFYQLVMNTDMEKLDSTVSVNDASLVRLTIFAANV